MKNEEYIAFMTNPDNIYNCIECPENKCFSPWQEKLPCGQWRCWVDLHIERIDNDTSGIIK